MTIAVVVETHDGATLGAIRRTRQIRWPVWSLQIKLGAPLSEKMSERLRAACEILAVQDVLFLVHEDRVEVVRALCQAGSFQWLGLRHSIVSVERVLEATPGDIGKFAKTSERLS